MQRCRQLYPELGGRVRFHSTPCVVGYAYNQKDCYDSHERHFSVCVCVCKRIYSGEDGAIQKFLSGHLSLFQIH
jgi:hypothetical protein